MSSAPPDPSPKTPRKEYLFSPNSIEDSSLDRVLHSLITRSTTGDSIASPPFPIGEPLNFQNSQFVPNEGGMKFFSETDYENFEENCSDYGGTSSKLSPESRLLRRPRLLVPGYNLSLVSNSGPLFPSKDDSFLELASLLNRRGGSGSQDYSTLDYLGIDDRGHEADYESSLSSRCSSDRLWDEFLGLKSQDFVFQAQRLPPAKISRSAAAMGQLSVPDSEYDNFRPGMRSDEEIFHAEPPSDVEISEEFGAEDAKALAQSLRQVTADIQKSFGQYDLYESKGIDSAAE